MHMCDLGQSLTVEKLRVFKKASTKAIVEALQHSCAFVRIPDH
jgi:hypothetical protein